MELMVLKGTEQTLMNPRCNTVLYVENNCKRGSKELIQYLSSLNYICHWHVNPYYSQSNFRENKVDIFPDNVNSINMLCFPSHDQASANKLPSYTKIDVSSGRFLLDDYNLVYNGKEDVLAQLGTLDSCER